MNQSNSVNTPSILSCQSFKEKGSETSSSSSSRSSKSPSPVSGKESEHFQMEVVVSPSRLQGISKQTSIRIPSTSPHITKASRQTYEVWGKLESHFSSEELSPFWVQSLNEKENPSSKVFTLPLQKGDSDEEGEIDSSLVELKAYNPSPLSKEEQKAGFRIVDPAQERAKKYFIKELEKVCGEKAIDTVYPPEERSEPLTAEKANTVFTSLELLRDAAEEACKGDPSKFDTYLVLEMDRFQSDQKKGNA